MSGHTHYLNAVTKRCIVCGKTDREINAPPADPWDACLDVDPFTGQPDQHPCGDACENEGCCE